MELTDKFLEDCLKKSLEVFKSSDVADVSNSVKLEYIDSQKFIEDAMENPLNKTLITSGIIKNFEKEYPGFLVVYERNKLPLRKILGLPYVISIDFVRAKRFLRPYNKKQVEKYFISVFLHELTHIFEDSVIAKHKAFYDKALKNNYGDVNAANEILAEAVSYKFGYKNVADKITNEMYKDIYAKIKSKYNTNPLSSDVQFKSDLELF